MDLPEGLKFLQPIWWLTHLIFVLIVYAYGYRKGRERERKAQAIREPERGKG